MRKAKVVLLSLIAIVAVATTALFVSETAYADCYVPTGCADASGSGAGIQKLTSGVYSIVVDCASAVGAVAAAMVMWASIQYSISLGNPGKAQKAKTTIIYAAIGVLLGFAANIIVGIAVGIGGRLKTGADIAAVISTVGEYIRNATLAAGVMAVLVGGFMMVSSTGNPAKVQNGKKSIIAGIIGVLIAAFAHILTIILVLLFKGGTISGGSYEVLYYEEDGQTKQHLVQRDVTTITPASKGVILCNEAKNSGLETSSDDCVDIVKREAQNVQICLGEDKSKDFEQCKSDTGSKYVTYPEVFEQGDKEKILCEGVTKKYVLYDVEKGTMLSSDKWKVRKVYKDGTLYEESMADEEININMSRKCSESIDTRGLFVGGQVSSEPSLGVVPSGGPQYRYYDTQCSAADGDKKVTCKIIYTKDSCENNEYIYIMDDFGVAGRGYRDNNKSLVCKHYSQASPLTQEMVDIGADGIKTVYTYSYSTEEKDPDGKTVLVFHYGAKYYYPDGTPFTDSEASRYEKDKEDASIKAQAQELQKAMDKAQQEDEQTKKAYENADKISEEEKKKQGNN